MRESWKYRRNPLGGSRAAIRVKNPCLYCFRHRRSSLAVIWRRKSRSERWKSKQISHKVSERATPEVRVRVVDVSSRVMRRRSKIRPKPRCCHVCKVKGGEDFDEIIDTRHPIMLSGEKSNSYYWGTSFYSSLRGTR